MTGRSATWRSCSASPTANGGNRALGTPGYDASVEYVARTLRDAGYTVETPEFTARSFSVQDARLTVDGAATAATVLGFSPATPAGGISAPLAVLAQDETSGCEAADFANVPAGAVVLVRRGACPFGVKSTNAAAAHAAAVLVANNADGPLDQATLGDVTGAAADRRAEQGGRRRARRAARRSGDPGARDDDRGAVEPQRDRPDHHGQPGQRGDGRGAPGLRAGGAGDQRQRVGHRDAAGDGGAARRGAGRGERRALRVLGRRGGGPDRLDALRRRALRRRPPEDLPLPQPGHGGLAQRRLPRLRRRQLRQRRAPGRARRVPRPSSAYCSSSLRRRG